MTDNIQKKFKKSFGERLKLIRESAGISRNKVSEITGLAISTIQLWEAGERDPSASNINMLADLYCVDASEFFSQKADAKEGFSSRLKQREDVLDVLGNAVVIEDFYFVPRYNIKASAGDGAAIGDETPMHQMSFRKYWVDNILHVNPKGLVVIGVKGDSMSPEINAKDALLVNTYDNSPHDGIYVLRLHNDLIVKRIQMLFNSNIRIVSANPLYDSVELNINDLPSDFAIIGRVVWFGRTMP